ncbi:unnamed protein product [Cuscuta campestris]|uniref:Uncharacterized protein n=1 Tax=Cuscuta campestris TaxID=132261 RepID=A0A484NFU3_9ASTE|nr:unnamed protein product [Cuscuta campestris]
MHDVSIAAPTHTSPAATVEEEEGDNHTAGGNSLFLAPKLAITLTESKRTKSITTVTIRFVIIALHASDWWSSVMPPKSVVAKVSLLPQKTAAAA